jgi:hypothetical protein
MRASYRDDAAFLLRLEAAVAKDTRQTEAWRKETGGMVHNLALRLLSAKPDGASATSLPLERQRVRQAR